MSNKTTSYTIPGAIIIEGHVQGLSNTRALGENGIPVYVVDKTDCLARYSKYCINFFECPDFMLDKFAEFLIGLAIREKIKDWVLLPSNDHAVYTLSRNKERLQRYYKVITPGLEILDNIYDKAKLIDIAKKINIPVPTTYNVKSISAISNINIEYPVIVKGRNGLSFYKAVKKKVLPADNKNKLNRQLELVDRMYDIDNVIIQELIPSEKNNKTISFTAFCIEGEIKLHWTGIKLREHPLRFGTATFTKSISNTECLKQSVILIKALNYTGVCEIEYIKDPGDDKYKLIEINPRTWLWVGLARKCGVDYARALYRYQTGLDTVFLQPAYIEKYWINPFTDTFYSMISILSGKQNPFSYIFSLFKRPLTNALFERKDMKPGFIYLFRSICFIVHR